MSYNTIYVSDFKCIRDEIKTYRVEILKNNFVGTITNILLGSEPVIQEWQDEGYKTAIRGCSLTVQIINDGTVSITDFYSDEDNTFKITLTDLSNGVILFEGFVVQDDCQEIQVDFAHVISISATDNLGLLKDITFDQALNLTKSPVTYTADFIPPLLSDTHFTTDADNITALLPGDLITISSGVLAGTYTYVSSYALGGGLYFINTLEYVPGGVSSYSSNYDLYVPITLTDYVRISDIFRVCFTGTNLSLNLRVLSNLYPEGADNNRWIDDTYLDITTFKNDNDWENCYDILEKILTRFSATLFQAKGSWYIVRWGEIFRYSTVDGASFAGYVYDDTITYVTSFNSIDNFDFHNLSDIETGLLKSINRPIKYTKEIFNFSQRPDLIKNANLEQKGYLINTYTDGETRNMESYYPSGANAFLVDGNLINLVFSQKIVISGSGVGNGTYTVERVFVYDSTRFVIIVSESVASFSLTSKTITYKQVNEYELPYWTDYDVHPSPAAKRFIREYKNLNTDVVIETYVVVKDNTYDQPSSAQSNDIQLSAGDSIKYTFDYKTDVSQPGNVNNVFKVRIKNNDNYLYCDNNGVWTDPGSFTYNVPPGDNTNQWHTVTIESISVPYDCILNVYLAEATSSTSDETHLKGFDLTITPKLFGLQNINGQYHTDTQFVNLKNNNEREIYLDDCIKPYLKGALFLSQTLENLRQKTTFWNYSGASLSYPLGHITTLENLFQNYYAKDIYNGKHLEIANDDGDIMSPVSVLKDAQDPELKRYVFGALSLNYREGTADFTMYEVDNSDITMSSFNDKNLYSFEYLYEK